MRDKKEVTVGKNLNGNQLNRNSNKKYKNHSAKNIETNPSQFLVDSNVEIEDEKFWKYYPSVIKGIVYLTISSPILIVASLFLFFLLGINFLVSILMVIAFLVIWFYPKRQIEHLRSQNTNATQSAFDKERDILKLIDDSRKTMAQIIGGIFLVAGLVVAYYNYDLTKQRLFSERVSEAVKLIKYEDQSVRTAGLYELQNISKESVSLQPSIKNVITLYINIRSAKILNLEKKDGENTVDYNCETYDKINNKEIEIASQILGSLDTNNEKKVSNIKLENSFLNNADLSEQGFSNVLFNKGCFRQVNFQQSNLQNTKFDNVDLSQANLKYADFRGADLTSAKITIEQIKEVTLDESTQFSSNPDLLEAKKIRIRQLETDLKDNLKKSL